MRTRLGSAALDHAGRRRRVAAGPPDQELVLRLQRTIGNRATTQLLQRKPESLAKAGVKTDDRVGDKTAAAIQHALEESDELKPYIKDKFPKSAITTDFDVHSDDDDFNEAAKQMKHNMEPMTKNQRAAAYGKIGGFYDRSTHHIHLRARSKFGHAVHESMHKLAHPAFHAFWDSFINEGVTQYFCDRLLVEHGLGVVTDHEYKDQLACAKKLVALTDWQTVAKAYFLNDGALLEAVKKKLGMDVGTLRKALLDDKVCSFLP
jgi:hypothetical protein